MFVFRFLIYMLEPPLPVIYAVTLLRGAAWGIILYARIKFLIKIVRVENVTPAILIVTAVVLDLYRRRQLHLRHLRRDLWIPNLYLVNMILIFAGAARLHRLHSAHLRHASTGEASATRPNAESK
ncbi:MAG: hypothetical protein MZU79_01595 [Anaerotruncus sp.]|nr:hypothetical protein [Anaerotruncus sp.]